MTTHSHATMCVTASALLSYPRFKPDLWTFKISPQWHIDMLCDDNRNICYERAVENYLSKQEKPHRCLDIGTGSGLLALLCHKHGSGYECTSTTTHTYPHTGIHTYRHTPIHPYTHTHIHTYTHTGIHPYTHKIGRAHV